jgi:hypothetical protein
MASTAINFRFGLAGGFLLVAWLNAREGRR